MTQTTRQQNDLRAIEYDEEHGLKDEWVQRAVGSARLYDIDEESIAVGLDHYEAEDLDRGVLVYFFSNLDRCAPCWDYQVLE